MNIIIPLGGKGERFKKEGFNKPKPLIKVLDKEILFYVIDHLVIHKDDILFIIYNKDLDGDDFNNIMKNKYPIIHLIKLDKDTKGASETIFIGLDKIMREYHHHTKSILLDGDTFYTFDIINKYRNIHKNAVFFTKNYEVNPIFSYIKMDDQNNINDIKEKIKISDNANTGAYGFNDIHILYNYAKYVVENNIYFNNECYTSCIISEMIYKNELFLGIELDIKDVHILGTPEQVITYIHTKSIISTNNSIS